MARFTSVNGFVGLGFETTTGTPVTPTQFLPIISAEIGDTVEHLRAATTIRVGGHTVTRPQTGKKVVTPKMSGPLLYNLIGALYRGIDATVSTTGSGTFTHVFSPGTSQGFTFELAVSGAIAYQVWYWPQITVYAEPPAQDFDQASAQASWELVCEEA